MSLAPQKSVAPVGERIAVAVLATGSIDLVARVVDSDRATELALSLSLTRLAVIRCVERASAEDHTALATMMAEGDFVWAGLVYGEREGSETVGLIETFHVSELDRLVSRLLELREVFSEPG
jgi:hypothetical protein